jgi:hypothetical protein
MGVRSPAGKNSAETKAKLVASMANIASHVLMLQACSDLGGASMSAAMPVSGIDVSVMEEPLLKECSS